MNRERRNNLDTSPKKKLKYVILVILVVGATVSCACQRNQKEVTTVRADFRTNSIFYSLFVFADGKNFVIKGVPASSYDEALEYKYADTSNAFVLDSLNVFLNNV